MGLGAGADGDAQSVAVDGICFGCAAAWALNGERPSGVGLAAAAGAFAGRLLVSSTLFDFDAAPVDARRADAAFALALNLAPPLIGALTISTLRGGAARLLGKPSPVADASPSSR